MSAAKQPKAGKAPHVWHVEIQSERGGAWRPGVDYSITLFGALWQRNDWSQRRPDARFRVRKYVRVSP